MIESNETEEDEVFISSSSTPPPASSDSDDSSGWLTSYADLMTLIACFFILMMAFANYDPAVFQRKAELMAQFFNGQTDVQNDKMAVLMDELNQISNKLEIKHNDQGLNITMNVKSLFRIGSADLNEDSVILIDSVIDKVFEINKDVRIVVEGHTDDIPIIGSRVYPSNWELSGARASTVVRKFETKGFKRSELVAVGFADTRPVKPNKDRKGNSIPENQLQNRRIVLKVLHPSKANVPLGLGVLFNANTSPASK